MGTKKKYLVIRFSSLGDIVLTSLLVRCLHNQSNAEIHFLTKKAFAGIVSSNPYIHKVWILENNLNLLLPLLKNEKFDLIIDLHKNIRSRWLRMQLWTIPVVSYTKGNIEKWRAVYLKHKINIRHIALRYLDSLSSFGITDDGEGLDYFIPDKELVDLSTLGVKTKYIALVIGAAHFTKRVPEEKLRQIIQAIPVSKTILIIGGKAEFELGEKLTSERIINTCGKYTINQSASLIAQSEIVIAPDTGMMHIAAALKKPIKSIWGSTLHEFGFWPFYGSKHPDQNKSYEVKSLPCRPCARFGKHECPKGHFDCMMKQDFSSILS